MYGFRQGGDGQELYDCVQAAVDQARAEGADYVVAVGHLGNEGISAQWSSQAVIAHTTGIDVFLDGHSHEQYERTLPNREGKDVVLAQTGTGLTAIGQVILDPVTGGDPGGAGGRLCRQGPGDGGGDRRCPSPV